MKIRKRSKMRFDKCIAYFQQRRLSLANKFSNKDIFVVIALIALYLGYAQTTISTINAVSIDVQIRET